MTDEDLNQEGAEEQIEDLEAPAVMQGEVAGGMVRCPDPTQKCQNATCKITTVCAQVTTVCTPPTGKR